MDRLILLRHGKAEPESVSGQDFDRILTERGRRDVALVCLALADAGLQPELALVSPAARTLETWAVAATIFPGAELRVVPALYEVGPNDILAIAREEGAAVSTVMVVGHNPGLGVLSAMLAREAPGGAGPNPALGFPTAAASVSRFDPPAFDLYTAKSLGGGA